MLTRCLSMRNFLHLHYKLHDVEEVSFLRIQDPGYGIHQANNHANSQPNNVESSIC